MADEIKVKGDKKEREQWGSKFDFLLSVIGFCVGLGNVWRFPYLCYKNGGGAFLVPYVICALIGGMPMFFLEVGIGQFMSEGGISVWKMSPLFQGIGYAAIVVCNWLNVYYIVIIAWAFYYFIYSFQAELPWASCGNWWNTDCCVSAGNHTIIEEIKALNKTPKDSVVEFWDRRVLQITDGVDEMGTMVWPLFGTLLFAWVLTYFAIWKGVKVTGKIMYFTATFPYVMLTALLVRGATLPGASEGIRFYLEPKWEKVLEYQVWNDAGTQVFYSYAVALGGMVALGSYNKFNNNFIKQCTFLCVCNSMTSLFAGFGIFSVLGFMSYQLELPMTEVAEAGPGLAFIAYPKAMASMPLAPLWSALFFCMILMVGLDSQFVQVESVVTAIVDLFPDYLRVGRRREALVFGVCAFDFLLGCTMVMQGGMYVFQIFDTFSASGIILLTICFCESMVIAWVYGAKRFYDNMAMMLGYTVNPVLMICWKFLTPLLTFAMVIFAIVFHTPLTYNKSYVYPAWAQGCGWILCICSLIWIPGYLIYKFFQYPGTFREKWIASTRPILKAHHLRAEDWEDNPHIEYKKTMTMDPLTENA
ncbi:sodium- and chloride-dependent GABA transporter 2 [Penaeus vannamei]|uniref:Transporter n=1 Tax=Penaeus vannamei TaxID=6689 RepID=A0A423SUJ5_PENVA|nr:sodium- and chloride-dependent GABA transporter 2-like [Penaeus vannamei]ROT67869.1 taurine transporter [Penaeus vannamei]